MAGFFSRRGWSQFMEKGWCHQSDKHKGSGDNFEIVGIESPAQGDRHQQAEEDGSHHGSRNEKTEAVGADKCLADNHAGETPDDHAYSHLDICKSCILGEERAAQGNEAIGKSETQDEQGIHIDSQSPYHLGIAACRPHCCANVRSEEEIKRESEKQNQSGHADQDSGLYWIEEV